MRRTSGQRMAWAIVFVLALDVSAFGQQIRGGEIGGTIKDDTGAALPGVTVTVTSPALQVQSIVRVSNERGEYVVPELPIGTFKVAYELPGFATFVREGIILTAGFAARVDVSMKVASLAETITVSGESPVVDVTTTRGGGTVTKQFLETIPGNNNFRDTLLMVGGMQANNAPQTGGIRAAAIGFNGATYGTGTGQQIAEGMKRYSPTPANFSAYEEIDVKTFGNTADIDQPGASVQMIVKSGGNDFHGRYNEIYQNDKFAASNIDADLIAQGITGGDAMVYFNDFTADLGGRIIRNKLWFYGNTRLSDNKFTSTGFVSSPGADGVYGTGDEPIAYPKDRIRSGIVKISYQATAKHKFVGVYHDTNNHYNQYFTRWVPVESSARHNQLGRDIKPLDWQGTLTNNWLVNAMYGLARFRTYRFFNGPDGFTGPRGGWISGSGVPSRYDRETEFQTGPAWDDNVLGTSDNPQHQARASVNYLPTRSFMGSHSLQAGTMLYYSTWYRAYPGGNEPGCKYGRDICPKNQGIGEYQLDYDRVNGVPHTPVEILMKNFPVQGYVGKQMYAWYAMDSWRPTTRLTLNLGLRWERKDNWVPPQSGGPVTLVGFTEPIGQPYNRPRREAGTWNVWAPRVGAAFDLSGDGKTVLKTTYGWFNEDLPIDYSVLFSQSRPITYDYRWHDLNNDGNYQPGEVNLDPNGPDFVSVAGVSNALINPDLRLPHTHEASGSIERQLNQGLALRGLYVYKKIVDGPAAFTSINVLRPYAVWNRSFNRRDPGGDGVLGTTDDGPVYTIYDYDPAYRGAAFVQNMNVNGLKERESTWQSVEIMLTKRQTGKWFGNTSFLATKSHVWRTAVRATPNDDIFPLSEYWDLGYLAATGYNLPHDINVSGLYQLFNGLARQRTNQFRRADPAGGPAFPSSSTITLPMEELGATRGQVRSILNVRVAKNFKLRGSQRLMAGLDAFNAFNSNVPWGSPAHLSTTTGVSDISGPTYDQVNAIVAPRELRFTIGYEF